MDIETTILLAFLGLIASGVGSVLFRLWKRRKGKASAFARDTSLDDVAFTAISSIGFGRATERIDGKFEHRPPFGARILGPAIAGVFLATVDFTPLLPSSLSEQHQTWAIYALWGLLAYTLLQLNFVQRVVYDRTEIEAFGVDLKPQRRMLDDLVDIETQSKRGSLVLTFATQKRLHVPNLLEDRARFVSAMQEIAAANQARGVAVPRKGLAASLGF